MNKYYHIFNFFNYIPAMNIITFTQSLKEIMINFVRQICTHYILVGVFFFKLYLASSVSFMQNQITSRCERPTLILHRMKFWLRERES